MTIDLSPLRALLGPQGLLTDSDDVAPFSTDWRGTLHGRALCVARPATVAEVQAIVNFARDRRVGLVPQGGNTGLCGGATPDGTGSQIVLLLSRMNRIRTVDPINNTLTAEAGCILAHVQQQAALADRLFPLSLAAEGSSQIGGLVSTNAGGMAVLRYGNMRDLVLGIEVVLPNGDLVSELSGLRKNNTGYDLKQLFIGAEGTLGVVTAATLKLFARPSDVATAFVAVPDLHAATGLLRAIEKDCGDAVTTFEIVSDVALALVEKHFADLRRPFETRAPFYCLVELAVAGRSTNAADRLETGLHAAAAIGLAIDATVARDRTSARNLRRLREEVSESERREGWSVKHDVSVPISELPGFVARAESAIRAAFPDLTVVVFGHLGDGSLHVNVSVPRAAADPAAEARLFDLVHTLAVECGGSFSAEHGIGQVKRADLARYKSAASIAVMHAIKGTLDPNGIMNPGKVLP